MIIVHINLTSDAVNGLTPAFPEDILETFDLEGSGSVYGLVEDGEHIVSVYPPDIIIVTEDEAQIPETGEIKAVALIKELRAKGIKQPILFLSNFREERIPEVLRAGAQLCLPLNLDPSRQSFFVNSELLRAQTAVFLNYLKGQTGSNFEFLCFQLNRETREIHLFGSPLEVSRSERTILAELLLAKGEVVTRQKFHDSLYPLESDVDMKTIDVFVSKLRKAIGEHLCRLALGHNENRSVIEAEFGVGYRINVHVLNRLIEAHHALLSRPTGLSGTGHELALPHDRAERNGAGHPGPNVPALAAYKIA